MNISVKQVDVIVNALESQERINREIKIMLQDLRTGLGDFHKTTGELCQQLKK